MRKVLVITIITVASVLGITGLIFSNAGVLITRSIPMSHDSQNPTVNSIMGNNTMSGMMSPVPQNVIIKILSSQEVPTGKDVQIELLVLDKNTRQPLSNAQVIIGIEKGAPMSTMEMTSGMFNADNLGDGKYLAKFKLDEPGYYTMHTHVIPSNKSMISMMNNHMDIGIIAK